MPSTTPPPALEVLIIRPGVAPERCSIEADRARVVTVGSHPGCDVIVRGAPALAAALWRGGDGRLTATAFDVSRVEGALGVILVLVADQRPSPVFAVDEERETIAAYLRGWGPTPACDLAEDVRLGRHRYTGPPATAEEVDAILAGERDVQTPAEPEVVHLRRWHDLLVVELGRLLEAADENKELVGDIGTPAFTAAVTRVSARTSAQLGAQDSLKQWRALASEHVGGTEPGPDHDANLRASLAQLLRTLEEKGRERIERIARAVSISTDKAISDDALVMRICDWIAREPTPATVNLNDRIRVRLTPRGRIARDKHYADLADYASERAFGMKIEIPQEQREDAEGCSTWTLWHFAHVFGPACAMIGDSVVEDNVVTLVRSGVGDVLPSVDAAIERARQESAGWVARVEAGDYNEPLPEPAPTVPVEFDGETFMVPRRVAGKMAELVMRSAPAKCWRVTRDAEGHVTLWVDGRGSSLTSTQARAIAEALGGVDARIAGKACELLADLSAQYDSTGRDAEAIMTGWTAGPDSPGEAVARRVVETAKYDASIARARAAAKSMPYGVDEIVAAATGPFERARDVLAHVPIASVTREELASGTVGAGEIQSRIESMSTPRGAVSVLLIGPQMKLERAGRRVAAVLRPRTYSMLAHEVRALQPDGQVADEFCLLALGVDERAPLEHAAACAEKMGVALVAAMRGTAVDVDAPHSRFDLVVFLGADGDEPQPPRWRRNRRFPELPAALAAALDGPVPADMSERAAEPGPPAGHLTIAVVAGSPESEPAARAVAELLTIELALRVPPRPPSWSLAHRGDLECEVYNKSVILPRGLVTRAQSRVLCEACVDDDGGVSLVLPVYSLGRDNDAGGLTATAGHIVDVLVVVSVGGWSRINTSRLSEEGNAWIRSVCRRAFAASTKVDGTAQASSENSRGLLCATHAHTPTHTPPAADLLDDLRETLRQTRQDLAEREDEIAALEAENTKRCAHLSELLRLSLGVGEGVGEGVDLRDAAHALAAVRDRHAAGVSTIDALHDLANKAGQAAQIPGLRKEIADLQDHLRREVRSAGALQDRVRELEGQIEEAQREYAVLSADLLRVARTLRSVADMRSVEEGGINTFAEIIEKVAALCVSWQAWRDGAALLAREGLLAPVGIDGPGVTGAAVGDPAEFFPGLAGLLRQLRHAARPTRGVTVVVERLPHNPWSTLVVAGVHVAVAFDDRDLQRIAADLRARIGAAS